MSTESREISKDLDRHNRAEGAHLSHRDLLAAHARGRGDLDWGTLITVIRKFAVLEPRDSSPSAEN